MDTRFLVCFFFLLLVKKVLRDGEIGFNYNIVPKRSKTYYFFFLQDIYICSFLVIRLFSLRLSTWKCSKCQIRKKLSTSGSLVENHYMKLNTGKCHLHVSITKYGHSWAKLGDNKMWECNQVKLLVVTIDNKTKFNSYVVNFCC